MVYLNLQRQFFKSIDMQVDVSEDVQMEIESSFSFHVNYGPDNTSCVAQLVHTLQCKSEPSKFCVSVEAFGLFSCEGIKTEEDKKTAHIQSYAFLFPYVQDVLAYVSAKAGLTPLMIEMAKLNTDSVKIEKP